MKTCKNCNFWKRFDQDHYIVQDLPKSKRSDIPLGECNNENFISGAESELTAIRLAVKNKASLIYSDTDGYQAFFYTCENFGCIHHSGC